MSNSTELGDFTLKQLLHLYKQSEAGSSNAKASEKEQSDGGVVSEEDTALFSKIMASQSSVNRKDGQPKSNLTDIFDKLIDDID